MTITDTPRARLEACLKAAKTVQTVESISKATGLGEGTVVNLLNAMRTENNVEGRKVNKGTNAKPKNVTEYWWTGKGIEPPGASQPPMKPRAKKPEKKVARSLTHDIVSVMQDHQPGTEFRSDAIASLLAIKFPDETVSRQIVAQRLSTMTGKHVNVTQHKLQDGAKKQPGGRDYYQTYWLINHPAAQATENGAADPTESEGGHTDVTAAPLSVVITPDTAAGVQNERLPETTAPAKEDGESCLDATLRPEFPIIPVAPVPPAAETPAFVPAAVHASHLDDIRHVAGLPDHLADDQVAQAVRQRIASMDRRIQDMQNQIMAISIALQDAGADIANQTAVESIGALGDAIKVLNRELKSRPCLVAVNQPQSIEAAVSNLRAAIAGTGATLTVRDQSEAVGVIYGRTQFAVARPGDDLNEVLSAVRTLSRHTPTNQPKAA